MFPRSGSEFCTVVITRSSGVSAILPEWHCKNGTMLLSQAIIKGRSARGKRSRYFLSCRCGAVRANGTWGRMSCAPDSTSLVLATEQNSWRRHNIQTEFPEDTMERRADAALRKVKVGEVSRARQCLTGATLAQGTDGRPEGVWYTLIQIAKKKNSYKNTLVLSSQNTFIQNHFIQNRRQFHPRHFRPKTVSSNDTFIQNHFHPKPNPKT